jgi:hypothetical protein
MDSRLHGNDRIMAVESAKTLLMMRLSPKNQQKFIGALLYFFIFRLLRDKLSGG